MWYCSLVIFMICLGCLGLGGGYEGLGTGAVSAVWEMSSGHDVLQGWYSVDVLQLNTFMWSNKGVVSILTMFESADTGGAR
jgi:hypothetical protein